VERLRGSGSNSIYLTPAVVSLRSRRKFSRDARGDLPHADAVGERAIRRAALITLRRAICKRFPAGRQRRAWPRWLLARNARLAEKLEAVRKK